MTTTIDIRPNLDLAPLDTIREANAAGTLFNGEITAIGIPPNGTSSGRASIALTVRTTDGKTVLGETTLDLFAAAARALLASPVAAAEGHDR